MIIRDVTIDDVPYLSDLLGQVYRDSGAYFATEPPTFDQTCARIRRAMLQTNAPFIFLIAVYKKEFLGWVDLIPYPQVSLAHCANMSLGVRKDLRGQGIGSSLIEEATARSKHSSLEYIHLETVSSNRPALFLYERFGFHVDGVRKRAKKCESTGTYDDIVFMSRRV